MARERRYDLQRGEPQGEPSSATWHYTLGDWSSDNVERLVRDPAAEDTGYIDRATFTADDPELRIAARPWIAATARSMRSGFAVGRASIAAGSRHVWDVFRTQIGWLLLVAGAMLWATRTQGRAAGRYAKAAMYLAISLWFCAPIFARPLALGRADWDQHFAYYGQVLKNVVEYGQPPFWNPWLCGGNVSWQNPQVPLLSPVLPLATLLPLQLAMKLNILLHYWVGFIGMHLLVSRAVGVSWLPIVVFLATLFTGSGAIALHLLEGHSNFLPVMYLPIVLFGTLSAFRSGRIGYALLAGGAVALMVWNGGPHVLPMAVVSIGALAAVAAATTRSWRPLLLGGCVAVSALAYAAPKLLPVTFFIAGERFEDSRTFVRPDTVPVRLLPRIYLAPGSEGLEDPAFPYGWPEYGNYVNPLSAVALIAGVLWAFAYRRSANRWMGLALATAAVFVFLLSLGEFSAWAPASLARRLPLLSNFRLPARYTIPFVLLATTTLAWSLRGAGAVLLRGRRIRVAVIALCLGSAAQLIVVNRSLLAGAFSQPSYDTTFQWMSSPVPQTAGGASVVTGPENLPMLWAIVHDRPLFNCYEYIRLRTTAIPDRPPVFSDGRSDVSLSRFQPNRIEFRVRNGDQRSRVYLNTNGSPGWHTDAGVLEMPDNEPPFVTLSPGQAGTFAFWFVPEGLWLGLAVFVIAVAVSMAVRRLGVESHRKP